MNLDVLSHWTGRVLSALRLIRLRPFDTATERGRSEERHRRIALSAAAAGVSRVVTMATMLVSVPLSLQYLGAERFGLWMAITSVIAMLGFADLGIGNGLLNAIAEAYGRDDHASVGKYVASAFAILGGIALLLLLAFAIFGARVSWGTFFNVKSQLASSEARSAVYAFVVCFAFSIPAGVVQRVQIGLQLGFLANLWQVVASIVAFIAMIIVIRLELGLPWLVAAVAGTPVLIGFLNAVMFFLHTMPSVRPVWKAVGYSAMKKIGITGLLFVIQQVAVSIAYASDNVVIARLLGAEAVTQYAVPARLFSVIPMLLSIALMPLWPAYAEAIARGDATWVTVMFKRSLTAAVGMSLAMALLLFLAARPLLALWVGRGVNAPVSLLVGLAVWQVCTGWGAPVALLLNGANVIRLQAILAAIMATAAIILKFVFIPRLGTAGAIWATIIAYALFTMLPLGVALGPLLRRIRPTDTEALIAYTT